MYWNLLEPITQEEFCKFQNFNGARERGDVKMLESSKTKFFSIFLFNYFFQSFNAFSYHLFKLK